MKDERGFLGFAFGMTKGWRRRLGFAFGRTMVGGCFWSRCGVTGGTGKKLLRVQVKSAHRAGEYGGYTFHAHGNSSRVYGADEIDVLAAYVVPVGAWYLFPVEEFRKYKAMKLFPESRGRRSMFEKVREV
jgi:hypothetical protein